VNARAIGIARQVRARGIRGVRDVLPTYRSVAVVFDPLQTRIESVSQALTAAAFEPAPTSSPRVIEVPVFYGGEAGLDLADVSRATGLSEAEVCRRHAGREYRVFMLGFVPGFAYMGSLDESIAVPRHSTPRVSVPAGSVAIAGRQTGIYPQESPGGWQIIGRTRVRPFDAARNPQFIMDAGDTVRFVPAASLDATGPVAPQGQAARVPDSGGVVVVRPGLLTTVQDLGRWGFQDRGVPVAGPMDALAHRLANAAVGNTEQAAVLEATMTGPELRFEQEATFAVTGADLGASLDRTDVTPGSAMQAAAGATLRFGVRRAGARAYVAVRGGFDVPLVLGSRATHVLSGMGGVRGRPLKAGDRLPIGREGAEHVPHRRSALPGIPAGGATLRVLPGPQDDAFGAEAFDRLQRSRFIVLPQSNRMAYRLGGATLGSGAGGEMISDAAFFGGIQVTPSGEPILLMADRQTTGGYPQIATVISADLPVAGQLAPGDWVEFTVCTRREAVAALIAQEGQMLASR
jgi:KipI family sensor histidine kinase inhibitor